MKKLLGISAAIVLSLNSQAQTVLDTLVVSAAKTEQSLLNSNRNVQIISKAEIEKAPINSLAELLDFAMGVDARQRGIFGTQTDLSIRGGSFEQVLVLLNGVRLSDPQTGHHLMNLPVPLSDIERVEILMGGGSYIFGANAFSGAINIITKKAEKNSTRIAIDGGQFNTLNSSLSQSLIGENWQGSVSGSYNRSNGFKPNTDFEHGNIAAQASMNLDNDIYNIQLAYTDQKFGAQDFYSTSFPHQYEKTKTLFASLNWQRKKEKTTWNREIYWRRNWDEFQLFREEGEDFYNYQNGLFIWDTDTAPTWYADHNYHRSDVAGAKIDYDYSSSWGSTAITGDFRHEQVRSNNLGDSLSEIIDLSNSRGFYFLGADRQNYALSFQQIIPYGSWTFSGALQANYNSDFNFGLYPALNAGYRPSKAHKFYANFNRSFRFPSYTDLYYRLGNAQGSINLQEEESYNYEIAYRFFGKGWYTNLSLFYRNGLNIIDWTQACDTCDLIAGNNSIVNMGGLEFSLRKNFNGPDEKSLVDFVEFGYSYIQSESPSSASVYNSLYVFDHLRHKINFRSALIYGRWSLNYMISYQKRNGEYFSPSAATVVPYEAVLLINMGLQYQWEKLRLHVKVQNLLDRPYFDRGNVEMPGIWAQVGMVYRFEI